MPGERGRAAGTEVAERLPATNRPEEREVARETPPVELGTQG